MPSASPVPETGSQDLLTTFLSTPQLNSSFREVSHGSKFPKSKSTIDSTPVEFELSPAREYLSLSCASASGRVDHQSDFETDKESQECGNGMEESAASDPESGHYQRSTLADALSAPVRIFAPALSECSSYKSPNEDNSHPKGPASLSIYSQELNRKNFEATSPICLPPRSSDGCFQPGTTRP